MWQVYCNVPISMQKKSLSSAVDKKTTYIDVAKLVVWSNCIDLLIWRVEYIYIVYITHCGNSIKISKIEIETWQIDIKAIKPANDDLF